MEFFDGAVVGTGGEQVRNARLPARVAEIRSDFRERDEHEFSLEHAWVRHLQFGGVNRFVAIKQNIQVDLPGALCKAFLLPMRASITRRALSKSRASSSVSPSRTAFRNHS